LRRDFAVPAAPSMQKPQIIVVHDVTQSAGDCGQLIPIADAIEINLGRKPEQLSADAGYCSEANLEPQHRCLCGDRPGQRRRCGPRCTGGGATGERTCRHPRRSARHRARALRGGND
jgi:hypothetical protein